MRPSYLIAASLAASVALSPALAVAADVSARTAQATVPSATPAVQLAAPPALAPALGEKAGCGAVLVILGKVAEGYPELFSRRANGKGVQTVLSALGLKGRAMMDEAFAEAGAQGLTPSQTYEAGVSQVLTLIKPEPGVSADEVGRKVGLALMQRCTGIE